MSANNICPKDFKCKKRYCKLEHPGCHRECFLGNKCFNINCIYNHTPQPNPIAQPLFIGDYYRLKFESQKLLNLVSFNCPE
jgi:hypothetical protein